MAKVLWSFPFRSNDEDEVLARVDQLKSLLKDVLLELPASSVEVEKVHSNALVDLAVVRNNSRKPGTCQLDHYVMSVALEHNALKTASECHVMGSHRKKVLRLTRNLAHDSTGPDMCLSRKRKRGDQRCGARSRSKPEPFSEHYSFSGFLLCRLLRCHSLLFSFAKKDSPCLGLRHAVPKK